MLQYYAMRCQYRKDPMGVDTGNLTFSWCIQTDEENWRQEACRIRVLCEEGTLIFDSGETRTIRQNGLYWNVEGLQSNTRYFWQVKVRDSKGRSYPWSRKAPFATGILEKDNWAGRLICGNTVPDWVPARGTLWFRKDFFAEQQPGLAFVHVASAGIHELYLNGNRMGNRLMAPSRTNLRGYKRLRYVSYDITAFVKPGRNVLGIWLDAGWTRQSDVLPAVTAQIELRGNGTDTTISTDETWICRKSLCEHIGGNYEWSDFGGERIDGRESPDWMATEPTVDAWYPVTVLPQRPEISWDSSEGDRVQQRISPCTVSNTPGCARIDMGRNYTGWVQLRLRGGSPGDVVQIRTSDKEEEEMSFGQCSEYVFAGQEGVFCNRFQYAAGRYITVRGLKKPLRKSDVIGLAIGTVLPQHGFLQTDLTLQDQIFALDGETFRANTMGGVICDCPHRERLGYGESGTSNLWGPGTHVFDTRAFVRQMFENWRDVQYANGYMPHVAPNFFGGGGISWGSCLTFTLWQTYQYMRDRNLLEENLLALYHWADYLLRYVKDGLLQCPPEESDSHLGFLGDWAYYEGNDLSGSAQADFFNNCQAARVLRVTADIAQVLGDDGRCQWYRAHWCTLGKAIHARYFDKETHRYFSGEQRYAAVALCAGIVPTEELAAVQQSMVHSLREKGYMDGGSVGTVLIYQALEEAEGGAQALFSWLQSEEMPGYGWFLICGENTLPELWSRENFAGGSRIHTCYSGVSGWYVRSLVGLRPDPENENTFTLTPFFPADMNTLSWQGDYGWGPLAVRWTREAQSILYEVSIPPNLSVAVKAPAGWYMENPGVWGSGTHSSRFYSVAKAIR